MGPLPGVNVTIPICWSAGTGCADRATAGAGGFGGGEDALALALGSAAELDVAMGSAGEGSVSAEQAQSKGNVAPEARRASARARREGGDKTTACASWGRESYFGAMLEVKGLLFDVARSSH